MRMTKAQKSKVAKEFKDREFDNATARLLHEDRELLEKLAKV